MDREIEDPTPGEDWRESLNATCNRLSTHYLNLLRSASSVTALDGGTATAAGTSSSSASAAASADGGPGGSGTGGRRRNGVGGSGSGGMASLRDPPPPPLATDVAVGSLQCQLAVENLCVAASHLLSLVRTLRLSVLLMDEETVAAEEEHQVLQVQIDTVRARSEADRLELEWMELRNSSSNNHNNNHGPVETAGE